MMGPAVNEMPGIILWSQVIRRCSQNSWHPEIEIYTPAVVSSRCPYALRKFHTTGGCNEQNRF